MGRPKLPKGEAKNFTIRARMSPDEFRLVGEAVKKAGGNLSQWARDVLLDQAQAAVSASK